MNNYEMVKKAVWEVLQSFDFKSEIASALVEQKRIIRALKNKRDPDLISTREAKQLRGASRVETLIKEGILKRYPSGGAKNSAKYISKKQLFKLDNVVL